MTGIELCTKIIERIKAAIHSPEFVDTYRQDKHFMRTRKLTMPILMTYLLGYSKSSMNCAISDFLQEHEMSLETVLGKELTSFTKQAVTKTRKGIKIDAFEWLMNLSAQMYFEAVSSANLWLGYLLFAIDGSDIQLPQRETCLKTYGGLKAGSTPFAMAKFSILYCVSHNIIVDALLDTCKAAERPMAKTHISALVRKGLAEKAVVLFDRGYYSEDLCAYMLQKNVHFVFRIKSNDVFIKTVTGSRKRKFDFEIPMDNGETVPVRLVRFKLNTGEYEYLLTDLTDPAITCKDFKELYFMRWPIELKFRQLKQRFALENFSGYSSDAIDQDYFIAVFYSNLLEILKMDSDTQIEQEWSKKLEAMPPNKRPNYTYQSNTAIIVHKLKSALPAVLLWEVMPLSACKEIVSKAAQRTNWSQINDDRHYERKVRQPGRNVHYNQKPC